MWIEKYAFFDDDTKRSVVEYELREDYTDEALDHLLELIADAHAIPEEFCMTDSLTGNDIPLEPKQFLSKKQLHKITKVLEQEEIVTFNQLKEALK